jgi:hypothetical protein
MGLAGRHNGRFRRFMSWMIEHMFVTCQEGKGSKREGFA